MFNPAAFLAFGFVTPAFAAAGAALIAIPIVIHILNRRRFRTVTWAAMEFLLRAMRKNRRRLKFEQWILLATRCAVLVLLGLALARPMGCENTSVAGAAGRDGLSVFIIDNSYSMSYERDDRPPDAGSAAGGVEDAENPRGEQWSHLNQAWYMVQTMIDRLPPGEAVAVITAAKPATAIIRNPHFNLREAKKAVDRVEQSWAATDLPGALQLALQMGRDNPQNSKRLYILTDSTASAWQGERSDEIKETAVALDEVYDDISHHDLTGGGEQWNHAVLDVRPEAPLVTVNFSSTLAAQVRGFGEGPTAQLRWRLNGADVANVSGAGEAQAEPAVLDMGPDTPLQHQGSDALRSTGGGPQLLSAVVRSGGGGGDGSAEGGGEDRLAVDNVRHRVVDVAASLKVLIVEGRRGVRPRDNSGLYIQVALAPGSDRRPAAEDVDGTDEDSEGTGPGGEQPVQAGSSYAQPVAISELELGNQVISDYGVIVLAGVGRVEPDQAERLAQYVRRGGTLMVFMGEPVNSDNYNAEMLKRGLLPGPLVKRVSVLGTSAQPYTFDFNPTGVPHPFLSAFRGMTNSGLDTASIYTYWQVDVPNDGSVDRVLNYAQRKAGATEDDAAADEGAAGEAGAEGAAAATATATATSDAAITWHTLGQGGVLFFSTSGDNEWTTFPAKPNFTSLLHELLQSTVRSGDRWLNLEVGQRLRTPPNLRLDGVPTLKDPAGKNVPMELLTAAQARAEEKAAEDKAAEDAAASEAAKAGGGDSGGEAAVDMAADSPYADGDAVYRSPPLMRPGAYTLVVGRRQIPVAVNVPAAEEADVRTLDGPALRTAMGDIDLTIQGVEVPSVEVMARSGNDFGWYFMAGVLVLLGVECFMAMRFGHYRRDMAAGSPVATAK